jgi:uncharacterized protein DUF6262
MTPEQRQQRVEDACNDLLRTRTPITFEAVATRAGLGRATLYRNPELRAIVEDHRTRGREASTMTGLTTEIAQLRTALNELAVKVRRHEEELRHLRRQHHAS